MVSRFFGMKVATAVLAAALAVGGVVAGARNAPPLTSSVAEERPAVSSPAAAATGASVQTPIPQSTAAPAGDVAAQPTIAHPVGSPSTPLQGILARPGTTPQRNAGNAGNPGTAVAQPKTPISEHSVRGLVLAVNGDRILLRRPNAQGDARVVVLPRTVIRQGGKDIPVASIRPGDRVIVIGVPEADGALGAQAMVVIAGPRVTPRGTPRPKQQAL